MAPRLPIQMPKWDSTPMHIAAWVAILLWVFATLFLADYYLTNNQFDSIGNVVGGRGGRLSGNDAQELGLGLSPVSPSTAAEGLRRLLEMRRIQKTGNFAGLAAVSTDLRQFVKQSGSESYRMVFSPILDCADAGCPNRVYLQTVGQLASLDVRGAGNAMAVEAVYWEQAVSRHEDAGAAAAVARLDVLVKEHGSPDLRLSWQALQDCRGKCAVFEEQLLDFIEEAAKN